MQVVQDVCGFELGFSLASVVLSINRLALWC